MKLINPKSTVNNLFIFFKQSNPKEGFTMKNLQGRIITAVLAIFLASLAFMGCSQEQMGNIAGPENATGKAQNTTILQKKPTSSTQTTQSMFPLFGSGVAKYVAKKDNYRGASVDLVPTQSVLSFDGGALTPPQDLYGQDVTVTFQADYDSINQEIVFTFGPHGSQFSPAAEIKLDWSELNTDAPILYYIDESGNYIQQQPAQVDYQGKNMIIFVDHFSRYALARS